MISFNQAKEFFDKGWTGRPFVCPQVKNGEFCEVRNCSEFLADLAGAGNTHTEGIWFLRMNSFPVEVLLSEVRNLTLPYAEIEEEEPECVRCGEPIARLRNNGFCRRCEELVPA